MTTPTFSFAPTSISVAEIATLVGAEALPSTHSDRAISNLAQLDRAGPHDLTFMDSRNTRTNWHIRARAHV